jgi:hypothetical protein
MSTTHGSDFRVLNQAICAISTARESFQATTPAFLADG